LVYTQSPPLTNEEIEDLLVEAKVARLCSHNRDGTIHAAPVWYLYDDGKILIATPNESRKVRNVKRDRNVTVLIDVPGRGVLVYGEADMDCGDVSQFTVDILRKYFPREKADGVAERLLELAHWIKLVVTPVSMVSFASTKDTELATAYEA
jgi:general stress protein 26